MSSDSEVTLREFMDLRFDGLEEKVGALERKVEALEDCITNDIKHAIAMWKYIGGLIVVVVTALVVAWLQQRLGI